MLLTVVVALGYGPLGSGQFREPSDEVTVFTGESFYAPPSPLPEGSPGDVIWAEEVGASDASNVWRILYLSESLDASPIAVSGIVSIPAHPVREQDIPIVAFAHGGAGLGDHCAPSRRGLEMFGGLGTWHHLVSTHIIAATDYEGLGTPGPHPYLVGESAARSVIDSVRAARQLVGDASRAFAVIGNFQGGHAALFTGQLAAQWAPELRLIGVSAGAPPAFPSDPGEATRSQLAELTPGPQTFGPYGGHLLMAVSAWAAVYPDLELEDLLTPEGMEVAASLQDACMSAALMRLSRVPIDRLVQAPVRDNPAWMRRLAENGPGTAPIGVPVLLLQAGGDEVVDVSDSEVILDRICANGGTAGREIFGGGHAEGLSAYWGWATTFASGLPAGQSSMMDDHCTGPRPYGPDGQGTPPEPR